MEQERSAGAWTNSLVVDPELRVHGILGLRAADASLTPQIIYGAGDKCIDPHDCGPRSRGSTRSSGAKSP